MYSKSEDLTSSDFFSYFVIIYDIEFFGDTIALYYKNKVYQNKMVERLQFLYNFNPIEQKFKKIKFDSIVIKKIKNDNPKILIDGEIIINKGDHILIDGISGSGKTTLLYILKGIIKAQEIIISPKIEDIYAHTYLTLPSHKSLFSGNLYDILTNFSKNPNIPLINKALILAKINNRLKKNEYVNIEDLSAGEKIRLLIARIIYIVKITT